jgi:uncharacterized membrane protein YhhN
MNKQITMIYVAASVLYIVLVGLKITGLVSIGIKLIPVLILTVVVLKKLQKSGIVLMLALVFSGGGDAILAYDRQGMFVWGLASFLIAHLFYIVFFATNSKIDKKKLPYAFLVILFSSAMGFLLRNIQPQFFHPVMAYLTIITLMTVLSIFNEFKNTRIILGSCIFMLSDSMIATNKFLVPIPVAGLFIMTTYYTAQYCIITGSIQGLSRSLADNEAPITDQ